MRKNLPKQITKLISAIAVISMFFSLSVNAQTDSVKWPFKTWVEGVNYNKDTVINIGNVIGDSIRVSIPGSISLTEAIRTTSGDIEIPGTYLLRNGTWTNNTTTDIENGKAKYPRIDFLTTYPGQSAPGWPALNTDEISDVWIQFKVSPKQGYDFNVNSISLGICGSGSSAMRQKTYISTDPTFSYRTAVYDSIKLTSYVFSTINRSGLDTIVRDGKSFYIRVYPWMDNQATPVAKKRIIIRNVIIKGTANVVTALPKLLGVKIQAYPNPTVDGLKIESALAISGYEVISLNGKIVKKAINNSNVMDINVSDLAKGIYFLKVYTAEGTKQMKFVKK